MTTTPVTSHESPELPNRILGRVEKLPNGTYEVQVDIGVFTPDEFENVLTILKGNRGVQSHFYVGGHLYSPVFSDKDAANRLLKKLELAIDPTIALQNQVAKSLFGNGDGSNVKIGAVIPKGSISICMPKGMDKDVFDSIVTKMAELGDLPK